MSAPGGEAGSEGEKVTLAGDGLGTQTSPSLALLSPLSTSRDYWQSAVTKLSSLSAK